MSTETTLATVERADAGTLILACNEDTDIEQLAAASEAVDAMWERVKEWRETRDDIFRRRIETHGKFTLGGKLWRLVDRTPVKVKSKLRATQLVLEAVGGDEEKFAEAMASEPFKAGFCRTLLGERWGEVFEETPVQKLDVVDKPGPRQLQGIPTYLLK
jgi:hypothetical protein